MALPRSKYVKDGQEGVFHCFTRCVRRAFLCGFDPVDKRDYSSRKQLLLDRLRYLAALFAIDVCAYAIMANHYHLILRLLPHIAAAWSNRDVALRWLTLFPRKNRLTGEILPPTDAQISALALQTDRIAQLRKRLSSLSWFMGRLNEFIARAANKEDNVKGRFWESRFKCQALLDEAAIAACMVYVDLNPIRAGLAATPEESDFASIQQRIRAWRKEMPDASGKQMPSADETVGVVPDCSCADAPVPSADWLCPIQSNSQRRGILQMTETEYFELVDRSGRILRAGKRGAIDADLAPILLRIGIKPDAWFETISRFESRFRLAAGLLSSLRRFADQIGRRWITGISAARSSFASSLPQAT
jgi:REP element-mobilizing transposase RayT